SGAASCRGPWPRAVRFPSADSPPMGPVAAPEDAPNHPEYGTSLPPRRSDRNHFKLLSARFRISQGEFATNKLVHRALVDEFSVRHARDLEVDEIAGSFVLEDAAGEGAGVICLRVNRDKAYVPRKRADFQTPNERRHGGHLPNAPG